MSRMKKIWIPIAAAAPVALLIAVLDKAVHLGTYAWLGALVVGIFIIEYIDPYGGLREPPDSPR